MKKIIKQNIGFTALVLFCFFYSIEIQSQKNDDIRFEHFTIENGLPDNTINSIYQDSFGFLWIATNGGLAKYDGYDFHTFKPDSENPASLSDRRVNVVYEDKRGNLWVGTRNGLNKFNRNSESFEKFYNNLDDSTSLSNNWITSLIESRVDSTGLWIGTYGGGINRLDYQSNNFERFTTDSNSVNTIVSNYVTSIIEEFNIPGTFWIATSPPGSGFAEGGISLLDLRTGEFYGFDKDSDNALPNLHINSLYQDSDGFFWAATDSGLTMYDPLQNKLMEYQKGENELISEKLTSVYEDRVNKIWIGSEKGLSSFDKSKSEFKFYIYRDGDNNSIISNEINCVFEDRTGTLWCGTNNGLDKLNRSIRNFPHIYYDPTKENTLSNNTVYSILEGSDGILWVGTRQGLNRFDRESGEIIKLFSNPKQTNTLSNNLIYSIYEAPSDPKSIWVGTARGLNRIEKETGRITQFLPDNNNPDSSISGRRIITQFEDSRRNFWIGTLGGGLNNYDFETGLFSHVVHDPLDPNSISSNQISAIHETEIEQSILWVGTWGNGLNRYDPNNGRARRFSITFGDSSISEYFVVEILEDSDNRLWVGTLNYGLLIFNRETQTLEKYFDISDGLPHKSVHGLIEDNDGFLWISTENGLSKLNPSTKEYINYDESDGLQSNYFIQKSAFKSKQGEIFFGGENGFNAFFPERVNNPFEPNVIITEFKLFNKPIKAGPGSPLKTHIALTNEIELDYDENDISFDFVGLHFNRPERNRYAYKLENYEDQWRDVEGLRTAVYTNLAPGKYVFRVRASNSDGVWNEEGASLVIYINSPIWERWYAFVFYFISVGGFGFGVKQLIVERESQKSRITEAQLRLAAMESDARAIQAENNRKSHELEEGRKLQLSLLPKNVPKIEGLSIGAKLITATEVGGDYYDFHIEKDGTVNIVVGDATGHGLKAGNMVSITKALFCADAANLSPGEFLNKSGKAIKRMNLWNLYMALTFVRIIENRLIVSCAGMPPILIYRAETNSIETIIHKVPPLGSFDEIKYRNQKTVLNNGDVVLLLTDGLPETFNEAEKLLGFEKIEECFAKNHKLSPIEIIDELITLGNLWSNYAPLRDDVTFMVIKKNS
ncbi:MAG: SpoIIE family protein phosphatase [Melioribacteraceae bacterium]|nr:SpoIIE family protein phosphatase [Melioribacteraceae bacterium]MCF8263551.1 SpoIIE family protein phosphatase [Melioribacteraceae bacterium]MCF8414062.1 SpoIIE family protein phosphatase [Melioribacteraceae bacterium]MCF8430677.1 SpoIIE family protein phosphatase [Melioribacteraceae bacterium]